MERDEMISMDRKYRTRDGREVRIYAVEEYVIHGAMMRAGRWAIVEWFPNGIWLSGSEHPYDLIEVKPPITRTYWLVHYRAGDAILYWARKEKPVDTAAIAITGPHEITFQEGDGL